MKKKMVIIILLLQFVGTAAQSFITVAGQKCMLNTGHVIDSISYRQTIISFDTKGFYGPYCTFEDDGYSKQYWYNCSSVGVRTRASSLYVYSGAKIEDTSFEGYGVDSVSVNTSHNGRKTIRGSCNDYFFRADYYCSNHIMLAYYYVSNNHLSFFDDLLDSVKILSQ